MYGSCLPFWIADPLEQRSPTFLAAGTSFMEDSFPTDWGGVVAGTLRSTPISRSPLGKNPMPGHLSELHPVNEVNTKGQ